ncbi:MAG: TIGR00296 family protein [Candidatus Thermoplasmatota archaeon]|jgi:hypothetical protein|nr:TIGR00296 family protein [Candidatus Thermoplasmatota archaeon]
MFTSEDGSSAVRIARAHIERQLGGRPISTPHGPKVFDQPSGVFVTLNTYPDRELRGCIGYSEPIMAIGKALREVAVAAATRDPRFPPVRLKEMDSIVIDVTLLTPPERLEYSGPDDLLSKIVIGRDGLIARKGFYSGLLLPQVPVEWGWGVEEFLSHTCLKAGLSRDEWKRGDVEFQRFSGQVFGERVPRGEVAEEKLG